MSAARIFQLAYHRALLLSNRAEKLSRRDAALALRSPRERAHLLEDRSGALRRFAAMHRALCDTFAAAYWRAS